MKKNWFYILLLMAIVAMPLTSCNDDEEFTTEEKKHDPYSDEDKTAVTAYNSLSWLQGSIVVVDKNEEVVRRVYGKPLDESEPAVISAPVADYTAAEKVFLSWVAPTKVATKVDGGYDYNLTDEEGKAQGSVSFRVVEGEAGVIARMTVNSGTDLKQVSEFNFVNFELWPENDAPQKVEAGEIYKIKAPVMYWWEYRTELENLPFYCIQSNTDGKKGILVWLCPDVNDEWRHPILEYYFEADHAPLKNLPTESEAQKVLEFYNNNKPFWDNMLAEMDALGYQWSPDTEGHYSTTGNSEFVLNAFYEDWVGIDKTKFLDLDGETGDIGYVSSWSWFHYRYMYIRFVPPYIE